MIPGWHQLVPISGHVEESETARKLQLYATSIKTSVSTRLIQEINILTWQLNRDRDVLFLASLITDTCMVGSE